ncbi:uncharacterized protein LOC111638066 [Centruroides sculpturatus]|uniref:uncharacterized protein LOC111638066 n=1 Tax=Centruroides sculpturatus TaxID=218467 RepID=UPI000C6E2A81|nr:uncharacterized protein LOC111638066 [Centruroides sculpturatus]
MEQTFANFLQLLTHEKEKLAILEPDVANAEQNLKDLSKEVLKKTELLAELKEKNKKALYQLEKLKTQCGILANKEFMDYYEAMKQTEYDIRTQITRQKSKFRSNHNAIYQLEGKF